MVSWNCRIRIALWHIFFDQREWSNTNVGDLGGVCSEQRTNQRRYENGYGTTATGLVADNSANRQMGSPSACSRTGDYRSTHVQLAGFLVLVQTYVLGLPAFSLPPLVNNESR